MIFHPRPALLATALSHLNRRDLRTVAEVARLASYSTETARAALRDLVDSGKAERVQKQDGRRWYYRRAKR